MMPVVRISEETFRRLQKHAIPLEDTIDTTICRVLDALENRAQPAAVGSAPAQRRERRVSGSKLPQKEFQRPILETLDELGGGGDVRSIRAALLPKVKDRLGADDYKHVSTGEERWWNAACWARNDLKELGLLRSDSPKGRWELSLKGIRYIEGLR